MQRMIDAYALKKSIEELKRSPWFNSVLNLSWHAGIKEAVEVVERLCIDKAPTIEAEPVRHGKWANDAVGVLHCSECNTQAPWKYGRDFIDYRWESNYCPECGARMDEE